MRKNIDGMFGKIVVNGMKKEANAEGVNLIVIETNLKKGKACIKAVT